MSIRVGDRAQGFELPHKAGETTDINALVGKEPFALLFFPLAFSSVCTEEMCHFRDAWSAYANAGVKMFAISVDSPFVVDRFRSEENIPFPVLSDFNKDVAATWDVLHDDLFGLRGVTRRAAFVVDGDGIVTYAWVTDDPSNQVPFDEFKAAMQACSAPA